jgi:hypothetical protein
MSPIREGRILQLCKRYLHKRDIGTGKGLTAEEDPAALLRSICCRRKRLNPMSDLIIFSRYRKRQSVTAQATAKMSSQSYCVPTGD